VTTSHADGVDAQGGPRGGPQEEEAPASIDLDDTVHQRVRLGLLTVLHQTEQADFPYLARLLQLTNGNLGRHLDILAAEGLVHITKGYEGRRPRTTVKITKAGRDALRAEMHLLKQLLQRYEEAPTT